MAGLNLAEPNKSLAQRDEKPASFADMIRSKVATVLVGKKADDFVTALISLMNQNPELKQCDQLSLVSSALEAQSLNLPLNKQLGQCWIVPFRDNKNNRMMATFQIGYKGYLQLAIRSGNYRKINVIAIKTGELKTYDPLNEEIHVELIQDEMKRQNTPTIGYFAMFEYINGFKKTMFWTKEKMEIHALQYSPAYKKDKAKGYSYSFWTKDFDSMAFKTMLRQILSKWGIMSVEMIEAYDKDSRYMSKSEEEEVFYDAEFSDVTEKEQSPQTATENKTKTKGSLSEAKTKKETAEKISGQEKLTDNTSYLITCPNTGKEVDEIDCQSKPCRQDCPQFE